MPAQMGGDQSTSAGLEICDRHILCLYNARYYPEFDEDHGLIGWKGPETIVLDAEGLPLVEEILTVALFINMTLLGGRHQI